MGAARLEPVEPLSPVAAAGVERVLLAQPRSFCAGVEMAIKALAWMVRTFEPPVYCYHQIVHNRLVVEQFRRAGVVFVDDIDEVPAGAPLMLSAHGSAPEVVQAARARTPHVVDAVCPLVKKVHHEVRLRADKGHTVVYAGHRAHDEAIGTLAVSPEATYLVEQPGDVALLEAVEGPVAFLAQTTLGVDEWQDILTAARDRFGEVWVPGRSDLCFATTNRQAAVKAIAPRCDAVVVIGSATSSNTLALVRVARAAAAPGTPVVRVDGPDELPPGLRGAIGVTAGASAAEEVVRSVVDRLAPSDGIEVIDVTTEDEYFPPPRDVRELLRTRGQEGQLDDDAALSASDVLAALGERPERPEQPERPARPAPPEPVAAPALSVVSAEAVASAAPPEAATIAGRHLGAYSFRIDRQIAEVLEHEIVEPWLRSAIEYHLGWLDERFEAPVVPAPRAGGKKLRATLAVLTYRAAATRPGAAPLADDGIERVVPFAAAIELVHNWSLVHDDIEDGDRTRRGRPALWTICGEAQAINVGDCVFALAFRCLGRLRDHGVPEPQVSALMSELARASVDLTTGQMRDLTYETTNDIDSDRYLGMIDGKTAALIRCATYGGALIGSGDEADAQRFAEFGRRLGLAFQMRDDILGIWGTDAETGKTTGADIRRRKKSLPVVIGFERAAPRDRERLHRLYAQDGPIGPDDEGFVRDVLDRCGAQGLAQEQAEQHRARAVAALADAAMVDGRSLGNRPFAALQALADFVTHRAY
ncbi:MAG TPA: 4-hydroxy-3-methylbut-2-enyl diphosphate reductase [Acidimicrobiales bacterium]|nr:4-hydroxy-3-methylbut-2-enyl diphosphate reductase [Acidimicrobiales bacterium]